MLYCWFAGGLTPNVSQYPELDLMSKCTVKPAETGRGGMEDVLDGLGNSHSVGFEKQIKGKRLFVGSVAKEGDLYVGEPIIITTRPKALRQLVAGKRYC